MTPRKLLREVTPPRVCPDCPRRLGGCFDCASKRSIGAARAECPVTFKEARHG
jgi:hypothetical protein